MVLKVTRDSASASMALSGLPLTSTMLPVSIAISVPVPTAMPRSACASAGASLREHLREHAIDADLRRHGLRGPLVVAGDHHAANGDANGRWRPSRPPS